MLVSIWWVVGAFMAGGTLGLAGFAVLAARVPEDDPIALPEPLPTR